MLGRKVTTLVSGVSPPDRFIVSITNMGLIPCWLTEEAGCFF